MTSAALPPLMVVSISAVAQLVFGWFLEEEWAWLPTVLVFWCTIWWLLRRSDFYAQAAAWLGPARSGKPWALVATGAGLLSVGTFWIHWNVLDNPVIILLWIGFALINPFFEEPFWRGFVLRTAAPWGATPAILFSSAAFAVSHPLIWGVHARVFWRWEVIVALFAVGCSWAWVSWRTQTLRWTIAGHFLANLLGLAAPMLSNQLDPVPEPVTNQASSEVRPRTSTVVHLVARDTFFTLDRWHVRVSVPGDTWVRARGGSGGLMWQIDVWDWDQLSLVRFNVQAIALYVRSRGSALPDFDVWSSGGGTSGLYTRSDYRWHESGYCASAYTHFEAQPDSGGTGQLIIPLWPDLRVQEKSTLPGDCPRK